MHTDEYADICSFACNWECMPILKGTLEIEHLPSKQSSSSEWLGKALLHQLSLPQLLVQRRPSKFVFLRGCQASQLFLLGANNHTLPAPVPAL